MSKDVNQRLIDAMFEIARLEKNAEAIEFLASQYPEQYQSIVNENLLNESGWAENHYMLSPAR